MKEMKLAIDKLLTESLLKKKLLGKKVALLGHPASVTSQLESSLDALAKCSEIQLSSAFGPQHGIRGEKQDNMIESEDFTDPIHHLPVFSLYGKSRRPTALMMESFDVILIDLQDVGTRIYTYLTTLLYILEESAKFSKTVWILDRPNPVGRTIEGFTLKKGWESFVGATYVPMRHGLTMGELALFLVKKHKLNVELEVIQMEGYKPNEAPGYGWPSEKLSWVNPSPNIPTLSTARCFPGTVLLEGSNLSEGRGTTRPLQIFGAPHIQSEKILAALYKKAPHWLGGCKIRPCYFEPTFHKFKGQLCSGFQIHVDEPHYNPHTFKPFRLMLLFFKTLKEMQPELWAWRQPPYEYENERLPIDLLNGGPLIREWVDNAGASPQDLEKLLKQEEMEWELERAEFLLYS